MNSLFKFGMLLIRPRRQNSFVEELYRKPHSTELKLLQSKETLLPIYPGLKKIELPN